MLQVASFRWAVGSLCALLGALMLVEPHQFDAPVYRAIQPYSQFTATGFLLVGVALLYVPLLRPAESSASPTAGILLLLAGAGRRRAPCWRGLAPSHCWPSSKTRAE